jgi:hypothetical protein
MGGDAPVKKISAPRLAQEAVDGSIYAAWSCFAKLFEDPQANKEERNVWEM